MTSGWVHLDHRNVSMGLTTFIVPHGWNRSVSSEDTSTPHSLLTLQQTLKRIIVKRTVSENSRLESRL